MYKGILTFLVLFAIANAQCPASYEISNLLSESVIFTVDDTPRQTYTSTFPKQFAAAPSVALGLQDFSAQHVDGGGFAVYPEQVDAEKVKFTFMYSPSVWRRIKINFWASANPEIQLGHWKTEKIKVKSNCHCAQSSTDIAQAFPANSNPVIRVFLNGYDVDLNTVVQLSVSPTNLQGTKLTVKITVGHKTNLKQAWISWLAFVPRGASFGSYGGQVAENNFQGSFSKDVSNSLYYSPYKIYGINLLSLTKSGQLEFSSSIDDEFVMTVSSSGLINHFSIVYVSVGVPTSEVCSSCDGDLVVNGDQCVAACPVGSLPFSYKDGGVGCRKCSSKLGLILSGGKCVPGQTTVTTTTHTTTIEASGSTSTMGSSSASGSGSTSANSETTKQEPSVTPQPQVPVVDESPAVVEPPVAQPTVVEPPVVQPTVVTPPSQDCAENAFFNGHECVCEVGYVFVDGKCVVPTIPVAVPIMISYPGNNCGHDHKESNHGHSGHSDNGHSGHSDNGHSANSDNGHSGHSDNGHSGHSDSGSSASGNTGVHGNTDNSGSSSSVSGSTSVSGQDSTTENIAVRCGPNAFDNGLGVCVCEQGYHLKDGVCTQGEPCQANAMKDANGKCVCKDGYNLYDGVCSRCPAGALYSSAAGRCIYVCGQNSAYSVEAAKCVCNPGFGFLNKVCEKCPANYFIREGFCVTCPLHSTYNNNAMRCECVEGFYTDHFGMCVKKCGTNEVYNRDNQHCQCISGLGRVNGACQVCPAGSRPSTNGDGCNPCRLNEQLVAGKCTCKTGYAYNKVNVCTVCSQLDNGFLINGVCAVCPGNLIYNGRKCGCPAGKINKNNRCISQCKNDQLLDKDGNCYTCSSNQVISNGQCVCATGYKLSSCGVCELGCASGQFAFQGACASCPLNTVYIESINGCNCPNGFYKDTFGTCQKLELPPIQCGEGQYFDSQNGCVPCTAPCKSCKSATECTTCAQTGYIANSAGVCEPQCGDGLIVGSQQCDTGSSSSPGCSSCRIIAGYTCTGQPSTCRENISAPVTPAPVTPPTAPGGASLALVGNPNINSNNVFISLKTNPTFTFSSQVEQKNFIKAEFPHGPSPTVYCSQRQSPDLDVFDCLLIYPSGVPNQKFQVNFSYSHQGKRASTEVHVDPFAVTNSRRRSRKGR